MDEVVKSQRSVLNRVRSIVEDAEFVEEVANVYNKPLVPNLRGGLWYAKPHLREYNAYFKSTDGHTGQCTFSLKRLNLHLLPVLEEKKALLFVDSTRRGKRIPDSFSKTVPIWCAVINYAVFNKLEIYFPPNLVAPSEMSLITEKVPTWAGQFKALMGDDLPKLTKMLRPMFVFPETLLPQPLEPDEPVFEDYHALILLTASKPVQDGSDRERGFTYVQGAGDDHEVWAPKGFDADTLWQLDSTVLSSLSSESECLQLITAAVQNRPQNYSQSISSGSQNSANYLKLTEYLFISPIVISAEQLISQGQNASPLYVDIRANIESSNNNVDADATAGTDTDSSTEYKFSLSTGKKGSRELAQKLPQICTYFESKYRFDQPVCIVYTDIQLAVALALLLDCKYFNFDVNGQLVPPVKYVSKETVQKRAVKVYANAGTAPNRITANVVGNYLRK